LSYPCLPPKLVEGLQRFVSLFDDEAATFLWNDCRRKVPDCTVEEVLHFTEVKAATINVGRIQNPTGFLLVTVPKCFEGQAFKAFREQERRRKAEQERREVEERRKAQMIEEEIRLEQESYRRAEEKLASLSAEEYRALYEQKRREYLTMVPRAKSWTEETLNQSIKTRIIREFQGQFLTRNGNPESSL
jgi:hypothetical protein